MKARCLACGLGSMILSWRRAIRHPEIELILLRFCYLTNRQTSYMLNVFNRFRYSNHFQLINLASLNLLQRHQFPLLKRKHSHCRSITLNVELRSQLGFFLFPCAFGYFSH